jgi:uncharacterized membrane protein YvlD (DUF360 family)
MVKILIKFILTAVLTYGLAQVLPNVRLDGVGSAAVLVIVLGLLNATVKPILKPYHSADVGLVPVGYQRYYREASGLFDE